METLLPAVASRINKSVLTSRATERVRSAVASRVASTIERAQIEESLRQSRLRGEQAIVQGSRAVLADAIARAERAPWIRFKSKSDNDCSYFGIYQYSQTPCTDENLSTLQFAFDVYSRAYNLAVGLSRRDPDTFGLAMAGIDVEADPTILDKRCPLISNPSKPALSARITWRGYARLQWYKAVCYVTSAAFWATNIRTGFLYGIGKEGAPGAIFAHPDAFGGPWVSSDGKEELWAWGPESVKGTTASWWSAALEARKQLFLPLPTQAFLAASQDPGLDQPWSWGAEGRLVDTQTRAELKRGQARRSERRAERQRDGFYAKPDQWRSLGGGRNQCPKDAPWKSRLPEVYDPTYSLPPDFELALLFSTSGSGLVPMRNVVDKGDASWVVPTGDLLVKYARLWLDEVHTKDIVDHVLRANLIYLEYLARFTERTKLSDLDPTQQATLRAQGDVVVRNGVEYVEWVPSAGLTLQELERQARKTQKARSMKVAGYINNALQAVASVVASLGPYGAIVAAVIIVVTLLIQLFTWLFGGSLVGCPKAPRPLVLRTFDDPKCNADIAQSGQTIDTAWRNLESGARQVGVQLSFPKSGPPPAPPPVSPGSPNFQFPGIDLPPLLPPPPPPSASPSILPALALGGALVAGAWLLLKR